MAVTYKVIFERYSGKFRLAGVADNNTDMGKIAGSISSKGKDHGAVIIDYNCNTPLNDEFFVVYTKDNNSINEDINVFDDIVIADEEEFPSENDIFLYKIEKSATDRVAKINETFSNAGVSKVVKMNELYNVEKITESIEE